MRVVTAEKKTIADKQAILVLNVGSSSFKFSLFDTQLNALFSGQLEGLGATPNFYARAANGDVLAKQIWPERYELSHDEALAYLLDFLQQQLADYQLMAVGHRVVHGGVDFCEPVRITPAVLHALEQLCPLAILHQPHNLQPIRALLSMQADLPQIACFDTAFHHTQPALASAFALPPSITDKGVRRYGFHGLSYEYIAATLPQVAPEIADKRVIVLHLGNGVSLCAMHERRSVATTMGFTALDGVPMSTRCGSLDPGVLLYLMDELKMDARAIEKLLYKQSGLLGVSGVSSDMRTLEASNEPAARFAIDLFVYRIAREIGSLAAALGGLDALVFTAGMGEHSALIREKICVACAWLGVQIDETANRENRQRIASAASRVAAWVIPTNEEKVIAQHVVRCLL